MPHLLDVCLRFNDQQRITYGASPAPVLATLTDDAQRLFKVLLAYIQKRIIYIFLNLKINLHYHYTYVFTYVLCA